MLAAPARSGKGVGVIIPNLLNWPGSTVCTDVGFATNLAHFCSCDLTHLLRQGLPPMQRDSGMGGAGGLESKGGAVQQIRREYEFGCGTIQGVARKFGVHRRMVRQALANATPPRRNCSSRARPRIEPMAAFVDQILEADRNAPRKQRHTAHRIYVRIKQELASCAIAESTVRRYMREKKRELGLLGREISVRSVYDSGEEAQVDG